MRKSVTLLIVLLSAPAALAQSPTPASGASPGPAASPASASAPPSPATAPATDVPVRQVILFSSGVGFFEHAGRVEGSTSTELRFKAGQINDILKSLVLQDQGGGHIGAVTYPSQDPLEKTLRSFAIDLSKNPALPDLLNQLRGARATVQFQTSEKINGTILGVETKEKTILGERPPLVTKTHVLNLVAGGGGGGIRAIPMEDIRSIQLEDPQLQGELDKALAALAQAHDQEKKPVTIHFSGAGERQVRIGYVIETPIWKTSYRLVLGTEGKGKMQGWAIVENQTESDWNNVMLSLVSGRPISFVQDLYRPLYIERPTVQPELFASLKPQTYAGGVGDDRREPEGTVAAKAAPRDLREERRSRALSAPGARGAAALMSRMESAEADASDKYAPATPPAPMDVTASIASAAAAANLGELFQYTIGNVTLPRQRSAMLPILNDEIGAERVSIFNRAVLAAHPLNGVRLQNTTGKHLLQGPVTVFDEGGYAGDARINDVPPGQSRLLSYGIDLGLFVNTDKNRQEDAVLTARIVKGVLELKRKLVFSQEYAVENKSDKEKALVIEHPFRADWKLAPPTPQPVETTETLHRFQTAVGAKKKLTFVVNEEHVTSETIGILPIDIGQLEIYSRTGSIPADVKAALARAIELKRAMAETESQIGTREEQISAITSEQGRIRENMKTVTQSSDYANRLLRKLNDQESRIETLQKEVDDLRKKLEAQTRELEAYLSTLNVG